MMISNLPIISVDDWSLSCECCSWDCIPARLNPQTEYWEFVDDVTSVHLPTGVATLSVYDAKTHSMNIVHADGVRVFCKHGEIVARE